MGLVCPTDPALLAADLFDILLPMLNIYQEFVRNHQYSLQILAHCKQNRDFDKLLKQYEAKPDCEERTLETFLTYPMFQVPPRHLQEGCNVWHGRPSWEGTVFSTYPRSGCLGASAGQADHQGTWPLGQ
jgi:hypothetical protein